MWHIAITITVLALAACKGNETAAKLKGAASFQLADGSPISLPATDEYNPNLVKMPDGFLMLVFGSDRNCGGCTPGAHNIFIARSLSTYTDNAVLPRFSTPIALTISSIPLNLPSVATFAATKAGAFLRVYFNNAAGIIKYADFPPTGPSFDNYGTTNITNGLWKFTTVLGIDAAGGRLISKGPGGVYIFDPTVLNSNLTPSAQLAPGTAIAHLNPGAAGLADAFFVLIGANFVSGSYTATGGPLANLNSAIGLANVSPRNLSILQSGVSNGDIIMISGVDQGATKQDMYVIEGTSPSVAWTQVVAKPGSTGIPAGGAALQAVTTATRVYGQADSLTCGVVNNNGSCVTAGDGNTGPARLQSAFQPVVTDAGLIVADQRGNRVVFFPGTATTATQVYGQGATGTSLSTSTTGTASSTTFWGVNTPRNIPGAWADSTGVYGVDLDGSRILHFPPGSFTADRVYGQFGSFTCFQANQTGACGGATPSANGLDRPDGVTSDNNGVYISDTFNNRVLYLTGSSITATRVYGQFGNFACNVANNVGGCSGGSASANSLSAPRKVVVADDGVYIADTGNQRVLFFPGTSTTATRVYGQFGSFTCGQLNNNGACGAGSPTAGNFNGPWGIKAFGGGLYVADYSNHRVLYFAGASTTATAVWGQFGSYTCAQANNNGACGAGAASANSLNNPAGVDADASGIYIAESGNNRVLFFPRQ